MAAADRRSFARGGVGLPAPTDAHLSEAVLPELPLTDAASPEAVLVSPPLTDAKAPEAVLRLPPLTDALAPEAVVLWPPVTDEPIPEAVLVSPPLTDAKLRCDIAETAGDRRGAASPVPPRPAPPPSRGLRRWFYAGLRIAP